MKIEIKNRWTDNVIFSHEQDNNTIKITVEKAVEAKVSLSGADIRDAYLRGADIRGAYLSSAYLSGATLIDADIRGADLINTDLSSADLCGADLRRADLSGAELSGAALIDADIRGADLSSAYLNGANLISADLSGADLSGADLSGADLSEATLIDADIRGADLSDADIRGANLRGAKNVPFIPLACPSDGAFIGWKKLQDCLIKLEIPEDAKRSSATTNKCRCNKAKVLSITSIDKGREIQEITNTEYEPFVTYKVGEMVYPDSFDEDRWNECSHGIHFFINKQEAINY